MPLAIVGIVALSFAGAPCEAWARGGDCKPQWNVQIGQPGASDVITCMTVFDDGQGGGPALYVAGMFTNIGGGDATTHVARWDGSQWQAIGSTSPLSIVNALAVFDAGDGAGPQLYAAGSGITTLARWNGSQWLAVPGAPNAWLGTLFVHDVGNGPELYVSGGFGNFQTVEGETEYIARWDGTHWHQVGAGGLISVVREFAVFNAGNGDELFAVGSFAFFNPPQATVIGFGRFDGKGWHGAGGGFNGGQLNALKTHDDGSGPALFAAGGFTAAGGTSTFGGAIAANRIAKWNGRTWSALASGLNGVVNSLAIFDEDGAGPAPAALFAAGEFTAAGGAPANHIARWDGSTWSAVGPAKADGLSGSVRVLIIAPGGGSLIAAGNFTAAGGENTGRIAQWGCAPEVIGDATGDGQVNVDDLIAVILTWGPCPVDPGPCPADVAPVNGGDGEVNVDDLVAVILNWGV